MEISLFTQHQTASTFRLDQKADAADDSCADDTCCKVLKITFLVLGILVAIAALFLIELEIAIFVATAAVGVPAIVFTRNSWQGFRPGFIFGTPAHTTTYIPSSNGRRGTITRTAYGFNTQFGVDGSTGSHRSVHPSSRGLTSASPPGGNRAFGSGASSTGHPVPSAPPAPGSSHAFGNRQPSGGNSGGDRGCDTQ